jgi:transcriptional regulator with XRE-family HTH domain
MNPKELKTWRKRWGLSQEKLANLLGSHRVSIAQWETGRRGIPSFLPLALEALENRLRKEGNYGLIDGMPRVQKAE